MNIGIDVRKLHDYGIGTHIRNVILHAVKLDQSHRFFLYCDPRDKAVDSGQIAWVAEESGKYTIKEQYALARRAAKHGINLFHSPHYTLPLLLQCKSIVTIHDLIHLKFHEYFPAWKVTAAKLLLGRVINKADLVLTVSNTSKEDILEFFPAAKEKVEVLYNRLSEEWLQLSPELDLGSLGIGKGFLLYVGNFKRHKDVETLLNAYRLLKDPPALVLVGNSSGMETELAEKVFATPRVRLLGFADGRLLRKLYFEALLFVFPSLHEGFGYPPLEAMSCGTPVLSSDAPALKEVLGEAAEFFQRGNAGELAAKLELLLGDSHRRNVLRAAGLQHAKLFTSDESPKRLLQIYRQLLR